MKLKICLTIFCVANLNLFLIVETVPQQDVVVRIGGRKRIGDLCTTSSGSVGRCIKSNQCKEATLSEGPGNRLRICGYQNYTEIVCCSVRNTESPTPNRNNLRRISQRKCEEYRNYGVPTTTTTSPPKYDSDGEIILVPLISRGTLATFGEFPHMVALGWPLLDERYRFGCGGTLISEHFVVTAAHCQSYFGFPPTLVRITDQSIRTKFEDFSTDFKIAEFIRHPQYDVDSHYNDIALIRLAKPVEFSYYRRPACLWPHQQINSKVGTITGWGHIAFAGKKSEDLLKADIDILNNKNCSSLHIIDSQICAASDVGKDTCQEDSGGPLQIKFNDGVIVTHYVVGVTSNGPACGTQGTAGIYTRISSYIDWIEQIVWDYGSRF